MPGRKQNKQRVQSTGRQSKTSTAGPGSGVDGSSTSASVSTIAFLSSALSVAKVDSEASRQPEQKLNVNDLEELAKTFSNTWPSQAEGVSMGSPASQAGSCGVPTEGSTPLNKSSTGSLPGGRQSIINSSLQRPSPLSLKPSSANPTNSTKGANSRSTTASHTAEEILDSASWKSKAFEAKCFDATATERQKALKVIQEKELAVFQGDARRKLWFAKVTMIDALSDACQDDIKKEELRTLAHLECLISNLEERQAWLKARIARYRECSEIFEAIANKDEARNKTVFLEFEAKVTEGNVLEKKGRVRYVRLPIPVEKDVQDWEKCTLVDMQRRLEELKGWRVHFVKK